MAFKRLIIFLCSTRGEFLSISSIFSFEPRPFFTEALATYILTELIKNNIDTIKKQ